MGSAVEIVRRWWELFEADQLQQMAEICQPDVEVILPGGMVLNGLDAAASVLQAFRDAFPDIRHDITETVTEGDKIAIELMVTGTQTGLFRTPTGDIPATGRSVVWHSVDIIVLRDGKIASWHTYFDQMAFLAQLGLLPEPVAA